MLRANIYFPQNPYSKFGRKETSPACMISKRFYAKHSIIGTLANSIDPLADQTLQNFVQLIREKWHH